ncbi:bifunctional protein FolD [Clostridia bacterium]|nr:bifunctional protein FolD [Clostridia bacterium]
MAILLKGKEVADVLNAYAARNIDELDRAGIKPGLAIIRVGDKEDDLAYERGVIKRCDLLGIKTYVHRFPKSVGEDRLLSVIGNLNLDDSVHGVLLLRPLPDHLDENKICDSLDPEKDVDGITSMSMAGVYMGSGVGYPPCTAQACMEILNHYGVRTAGKKAVIIGRSLVIGKPLAMMLMAGDATVTICHSKTVDLGRTARDADILVAALGRGGVVGRDFFRAGQTVIDVGINVGRNGTISGDVDFEEANRTVAAITPVPGGVGAVTTAVIAGHVVRAAGRSLLRSRE